MAPFKVGDITIHPVIESEAALFDAFEFFPSLSKEVFEQNASWLRPTYIDPAGKVVLCFQSFLVETPHHKILVDSCVGNHKPRPTRPFWHNQAGQRWEKGLAATGVGYDDIDYVMCTHLHVDHVGWNTRLDNGRWVPTFPKARYLFAERELAYWTAEHAKDATSLPWITDSVLPIVAAGRAELVRSDHRLNELVALIPTPGHTIDHYSVRVGKPQRDCVITGDMIHSPLQARYPELGMRADYDSKQAGASRRALFTAVCDSPTQLCVVHFPSPSIGRLMRWEDGFRFLPS
jgi:glyoxylase-like metal-dependent hydrolase (beta-lactamase superfamily II)